MKLIHLTDLHFSAENIFNEIGLADSLALYINNNCPNPIIITTGDITFKGKQNGYEKAKIFYERLITKTKTERRNFIFCPGNHDIVNNSFTDFDIFTYGIRRDSLNHFENSSINQVSMVGINFIILNSSYHLNHKYGKIDTNSLNEKQIENAENKNIILLHHHIVNQFENDQSAIRNAYDLLNYIDKNRISLILHGHQHAEQRYFLGKQPTPVISARSANFETTGYLNAFNVYDITTDQAIATSFIFEKSSTKVQIKKIKEI